MLRRCCVCVYVCVCVFVCVYVCVCVTTPNLYVSVRLETYGNTVLIVLGNFLCISLSRKDTKTCSKFS